MLDIKKQVLNQPAGLAKDKRGRSESSDQLTLAYFSIVKAQIGIYKKNLE